jgi:deoxyribose-phosphate aldolase
MTPNSYIEINAQDNEPDVTDLMKHVAEQVGGVSVEVKDGGSIRMTGNAKIQMTGGAIRIGA